MRLSLVVILAALSQPALAQSSRDQAADAMEGVVGISDLLTNENMEETVVPFETANPDEASLSPSEFEDRMFEIKTGDSDTGRAYGATVDSALTRPDVDLDDDPLALANDAVAASEEVTAGLFQGQSCEVHNDGRTFSTTQQCTRDLSQEYQTCEETRNITIDRTDTWSCIEQEPVQTRVCEREVSWSCRGLQGARCVRRGVIVSGSPVWNSARTSAQLTLPAASNSSCQLSRDTFTIQARNYVNFSRFAIERLRYSGAAQILVDGDVVWTSGPGTFSANPTGAANGLLQLGSRSRVYAGNRLLGTCSASTNDTTIDVDLTGAFDELSLGPSYLVRTRIGVVAVAKETVTVEIRRVNTHDTAPQVYLQQQSSCCTAFRARTGSDCQ